MSEFGEIFGILLVVSLELKMLLFISLVQLGKYYRFMVRFSCDQLLLVLSIFHNIISSQFALY